MRNIIALSLAAFLGACTTVNEVRGPDGRVAYSLDCGADRGGCYQKAGELCPAGYTMVDAAQGVVATSAVLMPKNEMLISCK